MTKQGITIVKKKEDNSNLDYWCSLSPIERLIELEKLRSNYNNWRYGVQSRFQRVYCLTKRQ
jgi:hypothetical protein